MSNNDIVLLQSSQEVANTNSQRVTIREQIAELTPKIPPDTTWRQLPRIKNKGVEYIASEWLNRSTDSLIHQYGDYLLPVCTITDITGEQFEQLGGKIWVCHLCDQKGQFKAFNGKATSAARKHLSTTTKSGHSIKALEENRRSWSTPSRPGRPRSPMSITIGERLLRQGNKEAVAERNHEECQKALIEMAVINDIPSSILTTEFRTLMASVSNVVLTPDMLPTSAATIDKWIYNLFGTYYHAIRAQLGSAMSKIHISFDTQSSANIVAIVAHFVDDQFKLRKRLLGLRRVHGVCNSDNIWSQLDVMIEDYGIKDKLGFFTLDNRGANDNALRLLLKSHSGTLDENSIDLLVKQSRIICKGHVMNIIAGRFMYTKGSEGAQSIAISAIRKAQHLYNYIRGTPDRRDSFVFEVSTVRDKIGFSVSDRDVQEFADDSEFDDEFDDGFDDKPSSNLPGVSKPIWNLEEKYLVSQRNVGDGTTWNDIADMVASMLPLKIPIDSFIDKSQCYPEDVPPNEDMSEEEWSCLDEVLEILDPFESLQLPNEDGGIDLPNVMADISELERHLRKYLTTYGVSMDIFSPEPEDYTDISSRSPFNSQHSPQALNQRLKRTTMSTPNTDDIPISKRVKLDNEDDVETVEKRRRLGEHGFHEIRSALQRAYSTLQKYLRLMDENPAYWASVALYPGYRLKGVRKCDSDLASRVERIIDKYWKDNYADPTPPPSDTSMLGADHQDTTRSRRRRRQNMGPRRTIYDADYLEGPGDELHRYLYMESTGFARGDDPLKWWRDRQEEFPQLHKFALDVLSIPATSAECERVFNLAESSMPYQGKRTNLRKLEETQCLKHWLLDDSDEFWKLVRELEAGK